MKIDGGCHCVSLYGLIPGSAFRTVLLTLEGSFKLRSAHRYWLITRLETRRPPPKNEGPCIFKSNFVFRTKNIF
jgi:hypothetical protein